MCAIVQRARRAAVGNPTKLQAIRDEKERVHPGMSASSIVCKSGALRSTS